MALLVTEVAAALVARVEVVLPARVAVLGVEAVVPMVVVRVNVVPAMSVALVNEAAMAVEAQVVVLPATVPPAAPSFRKLPIPKLALEMLAPSLLGSSKIGSLFGSPASPFGESVPLEAQSGNLRESALDVSAPLPLLSGLRPIQSVLWGVEV